jgi:thioester reductase-like protein
MPSHDSYLLLTGATGLLGRSLLRDLAAAGRRVAVIVRGSKTAGAAERVDELLDDWREVAGIAVPCPVVLEGELSAEGLGLTAEQRSWIARNVREVIHSAASLSFQRRESDGEPYTSNVTGTRNVLALCRETGIRRLHHVSSAYVCGLRQGRILESELDVGQTPGNDYERSKITSEAEATGAECLDVCTVHRPSIIVGDLVNGFTNTFHGFYKPLRIVQPFVQAFVGAELEPGSLLDVLGMTGTECKNLVPVDWVSAAMTRIILDESLHGRTYHLTSDSPTSVGTLCRVFEGLVVEMAAELTRQREAQAAAGTGRAKDAAAFDPLMLGKLFLDQMHVYKAYWRDDPQFDATNTRRAVPGLPAPVLDEETIRRLCRFAIANNFRWPPPGRTARRTSPRAALERLLGPPAWTPAPGAHAIGLAAIGAGGGQWTIAIDSGRPASLHVGLPSSSVPSVWLAADVLEAVLNGQETGATVQSRGGIAIEGGEPTARSVALGILERLRMDADGVGDHGMGGRGPIDSRLTAAGR